MHTSILALAGALALTSALPQSSGAQQAYTCGSDCASKKQQLVSEGLNALDLAVTFQEEGTSFTASAYQPGDGKQGDSYNFGIFKNNWFMIRTYCSEFANGQPNDPSPGAVLNTDNAAAIRCMNEQVNKLGLEKWYAGQRCGQSGIDGTSNPAVIQQYKTGIEYILNWVNSDPAHLTDDMAIGYDTPAVGDGQC